ncbi:MAG: PAS domain-containing protein, partial [Erysipelotrichaceae bacterium]
IKDCAILLTNETLDTTAIDRQLGTLYFALYGCIEKEERILFPLAQELLTSQEMDALLRESFDYGFPFIQAPSKPLESKEDSLPSGVFKTETGSLSNTEILAIFSALPVDLTFVDAHDKVRFFSKAKDRIFPRTPAILGRDVRHCHPPDSVHVVLEIIDTFRAGTQDSATFWIQMGFRFILIQYFALRDPDGVYLGTLEVSQNVTEIRGLEGQRRILSWEAEK